MTNKRSTIGGGAGAIASAFLDFRFGHVDTGSVNALPTNLANHILDFLTRVAYPLAFLGILYCAYLLLTSMGSADAWTKAKKNITYIMTGILLILFAVIIFNIVNRIFSNIAAPS